MKEYWKDIEAKNGKPVQLPEEPAHEDNSVLSVFEGLKRDASSSRRDFLKLCGYSFALGALASCQTKVRRAVPYAVAPIEVIPGEANYYASSYMDGPDYCSIIVKTRDGRPIKIEGNPASSVSLGGTSARVQASVLDLYDSSRFQGPEEKGIPAEWAVVDQKITSRLGEISASGGRIVLLTSSVYSPATEEVIQGFRKAYPGTHWLQYDAISHSGMLEANLASFGWSVLPDYRFDRADLVLSFGADFLGSWISPAEFTAQFSSRRDPDKEMCRLIQMESILSLTGSNADARVQIRPSDEPAILMNIYAALADKIAGTVPEDPGVEPLQALPFELPSSIPNSAVDVTGVVDELLDARGRSLVISGSNDPELQKLVNAINQLLGNIGKTILFENHLRTFSGIDAGMRSLVEDMNAGAVDALLIHGVNPAYTWAETGAFAEGMNKVGLSVFMGGSPDETSGLCDFVCPDHHFLESWNDAEPKRSRFSLQQPVIGNIFDTRQFQQSLLNWSGAGIGYFEFLSALWTERFAPLQTDHLNPQSFLDHTLQAGVFEPALAASDMPAIGNGTRSEATAGSPGEGDPSEGTSQERTAGNPSARSSVPDFDKLLSLKGDSAFELVLYESISMGSGRQANNPWLQELPDPVSKVCWDNYLTISPSDAASLGLNGNDLAELPGLKAPVYIMPGQAKGTLGIALGYGREVCGMVGKNTGVNAWSLLKLGGDHLVYHFALDNIASSGEKYELAQTQSHHSMEGRAMVREAKLPEYRLDPAAGNEMHGHVAEHMQSLYKEREFMHHHWGMAIDLGKCTGCSNCVIACQAENNIPVVGKEEVQRVHEMHWLRIDRYFTGEGDDPQVVFQPVMCQHCDNAPCENVCPVAATNSSSEGLNQMAYNRCIGTRYCNNNCPYKVRRFNWFNYTDAGTLSGNLRDRAEMTGDLRRMVLNPDVTVRSQGVIEKCSFCIQRIQAAKLSAKAENRGLDENELQTACSQSCPANAIVFGDMNDPGSELSKLMKSGRRYNLLEEIYTKPSVHYLTKIRNA